MSRHTRLWIAFFGFASSMLLMTKVVLERAADLTTWWMLNAIFHRGKVGLIDVNIDPDTADITLMVRQFGSRGSRLVETSVYVENRWLMRGKPSPLTLQKIYTAVLEQTDYRPVAFVWNGMLLTPFQRDNARVVANETDANAIRFMRRMIIDSNRQCRPDYAHANTWAQR